MGNITEAKRRIKKLEEGQGDSGDFTNLGLTGSDLKILIPLLTELGNLKTIDLSDNNLENLPESIGHLDGVEHLILRNNEIEEVTESIKNMTSLITLDLTQNWLENLPESIGEMPSLEYLKVSKNDIENLPINMGNLTKLKVFELSSNPLSEETANLLKETFDSNVVKLIRTPKETSEVAIVNLGGGGEGFTINFPSEMTRPDEKTISNLKEEGFRVTFESEKEESNSEEEAISNLQRLMVAQKPSAASDETSSGQGTTRTNSSEHLEAQQRFTKKTKTNKF